MAGETEWMISIQRNLEDQTACSSGKECIYKVPGWLKDQVSDGNDTSSHKPEIISFGPYHRGNKELVEMEAHKWRCLRIMLARNSQHIELYLDEMRKLEDVTRGCYQGRSKLKSDAFVEMLVLDGCFMLQFLRANKVGYQNAKYAVDDPVFSKVTILHVIARDMIKLENQLPLMVLEKLLSIQYNRTIGKKHIPNLVLRALSPIWVTNESLTSKQLKKMRITVASKRGNMMLHCLDIFMAGLLYDPSLNSEGETCVEVENDVEMSDVPSQSRDNDIVTPISDQEERSDQEITTASVSIPPILRRESHVSGSSSNSDQEEEEEHLDAENKSQMTSCLKDGLIKVINWGPSYQQIWNNSELTGYCVEDLRAAGVKFKSKKKQPFWDLTFDEHRGILEIPPIKIDDATKVVLLNLIAYEQCHLRLYKDMIITDYVAFMDKLVSSGADVGHLHKAGIIFHQLGSDTEVAELFNRLLKKAYVNWENGRFSDSYEKLSKYCTVKRHRYCAELRRDHCKSPWVIASLVFAIFLIILASAQTYFAIFAYYKPPKSN